MYSHKQERCHLHILLLSFSYQSCWYHTQLITAKIPAFHEITGFRASAKLASYAQSPGDIGFVSLSRASAGNQS